MSTQANIPPETPPDPHGIDREREQRLTNVFIGLIGAGFVIVLLMLGAAFVLQRMYGTEVVPIAPPQWDAETTEPATIPGTHP